MITGVCYDFDGSAIPEGYRMGRMIGSLKRLSSWPAFWQG
jgi:hypothetical protein